MSARLRTRKEAEARRAAEMAAAMASSYRQAETIEAQLLEAIINKAPDQWSRGSVAESVALAMRSTRERVPTAAARRLLIQVYRSAPELLTPKPPYEDPWFLSVILRVAANSHLWIRPPEGWTPGRGGPIALIGQLVRYLFASFPVPRFMDSAFFIEDPGRQVDWYFHIGTGQSIRTAAGLRAPLTKRMAHEMMQAPDDCGILQALRYGQIVGMEGSMILAQQVMQTRLGDRLLERSEEEWWLTVLRWFVNYLDDPRQQAGPIFDYLWARRYGNELNGQTPDGHFDMKGRTLEAVLRLVNQWHGYIYVRARVMQNRQFRPSGFDAGSWETGTEACPCRWTVSEILTLDELYDEGQAMGHCVANYADWIASGNCAIWSLRSPDLPHPTHGLTLEVSPGRRQIVQARGRFNRPPSQLERDVLKRWAEENDLEIRL